MSDTVSIPAEYRAYTESGVVNEIAQRAHSVHFIGQTSSANFSEIEASLVGLGLNDSSVILDAGCGNGCFSIRLAADLGFDVVGTDLSPDLVTLAARGAMAAGVADKCQFRCEDFAVPCKESEQYDAVIVVGSLYWGPQIEGAFSAWSRQLKHHGSLIIFSNCLLHPLNDDEQAAVGHTQFPSYDAMREAMGRYGFVATVSDQTGRYIEWLHRWCRATADLYHQLVEEMGEDAAAKFRKRFETYRQLAESGKVSRNVFVGRS